MYPVYPVPESILNLMWDFGNPCNHIWMDEEELIGSQMAQIAIPNERTVLLDPVTDEKVHIKAMVHIIIERDLVCEGCPSQGFDALHTWLGVKWEEFRLAPDAHWQCIRTLMTECIVKAQSFIRDTVKGQQQCEPSGCVALRALGSLDSWAFCRAPSFRRSDTVIGLPGHPLQVYQHKQLRDALVRSNKTAEQS